MAISALTSCDFSPDFDAVAVPIVARGSTARRAHWILKLNLLANGTMVFFSTQSLNTHRSGWVDIGSAQGRD